MEQAEASHEPQGEHPGDVLLGVEGGGDTGPSQSKKGKKKKAAVQKLDDEVEILKSQIQTLETDKKILKSQALKWQHYYEAERDFGSKEIEEYESKKLEYVQQAKEAGKSSVEKRQLEKCYTELETRCERMQEELDEEKTARRELQQSLTKERRINQTQGPQVKSLEKKKTEAEATIKGLEGELQKARAEIVALVAQGKSKDEGIEEEVKALHLHIKELKDASNHWMETAKGQESEVTTLNNTIFELEQKLLDANAKATHTIVEEYTNEPLTLDKELSDTGCTAEIVATNNPGTQTDAPIPPTDRPNTTIDIPPTASQSPPKSLTFVMKHETVVLFGAIFMAFIFIMATFYHFHQGSAAMSERAMWMIANARVPRLPEENLRKQAVAFLQMHHRQSMGYLTPEKVRALPSFPIMG